MIERKRKRTARIGVFGVVHEVYYEQFEGLKENLEQYHSDFISILKENDVEIMNYGIIGNNEDSYSAAEKIKGDRIDLLMCNMITYATSSVFAPIVRECDIPMVLVALQPLSKLDYSKASTFMQLENDNICSVPEFTGVAIRLGKKINDVIIGTLYNDKEAEKEIAKWCDIAKVLHDLKGARMGLMGHTMEAMYDMHADPTALSAAFGLHIPLLEVDDVIEVYNTVTEEEVQAKIKIIDEEFDMPEPKSDPVTSKLTDADKYQAAKTAVALDKFVEKYNLTGLAYYYEGGAQSLHRKVATTFIVGNSILNAQGIPMCGEYDIKTCIAMLIIEEDKENFDKLENILSNLKITFKFSEMSPIARIIDGNTYQIPQKGIYKAVKFKFSDDEVTVNLISDEKDYQFTAGFTKPVYGKAIGTDFAALEQADNSETIATAVWKTKKDLEITLRLFGTPSIVKVIADFSKEPAVELVTVRCKF